MTVTVHVKVPNKNVAIDTIYKMNIYGVAERLLFYLEAHMLKSCGNCGSTHEKNETCPRKQARKKQLTYIDKWRNSHTWRRKSLEIREQDLFLCLNCKDKGQYTFSDLSVHHIIPLVRDWSKRLENTNLITLCTYCHTLAERGEIATDKLYQLIEKRNESGFQNAQSKFK
jgi:5-methylcytosine-specific restriction protein A